MEKIFSSSVISIFRMLPWKLIIQMLLLRKMAHLSLIPRLSYSRKMVLLKANLFLRLQLIISPIRWKRFIKSKYSILTFLRTHSLSISIILFHHQKISPFKLVTWLTLNFVLPPDHSFHFLLMDWMGLSLCLSLPLKKIIFWEMPFLVMVSKVWIANSQVFTAHLSGLPNLLKMLR